MTADSGKRRLISKEPDEFFHRIEDEMSEWHRMQMETLDETLLNCSMDDLIDYYYSEYQEFVDCLAGAAKVYLLISINLSIKKIEKNIAMGTRDDIHKLDIAVAIYYNELLHGQEFVSKNGFKIKIGPDKLTDSIILPTLIEKLPRLIELWSKLIIEKHCL